MAAEIRNITSDDPLLDCCRSDLVEGSSNIWAGFWDGELVGLWGVVPGSLLSETAYIWSFILPSVAKCKKTFLRVTKDWVEDMLKEYTTLCGLTNCKTVFIKHLGAEFHDGIDGYSAFTIRAR
jgi:hypothetical protein